MPQVKIERRRTSRRSYPSFQAFMRKAGVLADVRKREFYEKPTQERKRKKLLQLSVIKRN